MAHYVKNFDGKKVICGGTTSELVSRELNLSINSNTELEDKDLPPLSSMEGVDLVTEGILTLGKVHNILRDYNRSFKLGKGPADRIARLMADSDDIEFLVGTRINEAHQDPNLPVELEIRRTVIRRIANLLETKFLKEVKVRFI
jgi:hypothetical protein